MAIIDEIESDAILGIVILGVIYYLGKKLVAGVTAGAAAVVQGASYVASEYDGTFYTPTNSYGANTVVTASQDMSGPNGAASTATADTPASGNPNPKTTQPEINTDPFIWGTSF